MDYVRGYTPAQLAALDGTFFPLTFVYVDWPVTPIRAHEKAGTITWGGNDWLGVGNYGSISIPAEQTGLAASSATLRLLAAPEDTFDIQDDPVRNRTAIIYSGLVATRNSTVLIGDPIELFAGHVDSMDFSTEVVTRSDGGQERMQAIDIGIVSGPGARSKASIYHSDQDQSRAYPGDTAGRHLAFNRDNLGKLTW